MKQVLRYTLNFTVATFMALVVCAPLSSPSASAVVASDWQSGNIISDTVYTYADDMSVADIQNFLNSKVPNCDTNGTQPATEYGRPDLTHAQYATQVRGWPGPPYVCLKDYHEVPKYTPGDYIPANNYSGTIPAGAVSAAQIIYDAAKSNNINPKVILVKIATESAGPLTTDTWPLQHQYTYAMGSHCPDSGPNGEANCDRNYSGFSMQVFSGTQLMRYYLDSMEQPWWSYKRVGSGVTLYDRNGKPYNSNYVAWNVPTSCGGTVIDIKSKGTAALYTYTPYQPNQVALNNMYGYGDGCSAYGNRNFWRVFNDWFGSSTDIRFIPLTNPRYLQIKNDGTHKKHVSTGLNVGEPLEKGKQIKFVDKTSSNGVWYLRTEYNYSNGAGNYGISQTELEEIPFTSIEPKWVSFTDTGNRSHPASRTTVGDIIVKGTSVKVVDQITVDGNLYYRTDLDHNDDKPYGIHTRFLSDFTPISLDNPRNFCTNLAVDRLNPLTSEKIDTVQAGTYFINKKTFINGEWYFQADNDNGTMKFIESSNLHKVCFVPFESPRSMRVNRDVSRFNPYTNEAYDTLRKDSVVAFSTKIYLNNQWYYRTLHNTENNIVAVIPATAVSEL